MIRRRVTHEDMTLFFNELERMARAGGAWQDGLRDIARNETGSMARLAEAVAERLRRGEPMSEALRVSPAISPYALALIKAGEAGGDMTGALRDAALMSRRMQLSRRAWRSAARYPAIVFSLFLIVVVFLSFMVFPKFEDVYGQIYGDLDIWEYPRPTFIMIHVARFIRDYYAVAAGIAVLLGGAAWTLGRTLRGRLFFSNLAQLIPGIGRAIMYDAAGRFCRALASLLERRLPVDAAVMLAAGTAETMLSRKMAGRMVERLRVGGGMWEGMIDSNAFPPTMVWIIRKAEEHGDAPGAFRQMADLYDDKFVDLNTKLIDLIEPLLLIIVGGIVSFVLASLFMPMFNLGSHLL